MAELSPASTLAGAALRRQQSGAAHAKTFGKVGRATEIASIVEEGLRQMSTEECELTRQEPPTSKKARRHARIIRHARRALNAFGCDARSMTDVEVEMSCIALSSWLTQALIAKRE